MSRHNLTDLEWKSIVVYLPAERSGRAGRPWKPHRQVVNGIIFVLRTGIAWEDLPTEFGKWKTVYNRFRRWVKSGPKIFLVSGVSIRFVHCDQLQSNHQKTLSRACSKKSQKWSPPYKIREPKNGPGPTTVSLGKQRVKNKSLRQNPHWCINEPDTTVRNSDSSSAVTR